MKYYVTYAVDGTITAEIEAASKEEAIIMAVKGDAFPDDVDFGHLENPSADLIQIDDAEGNTVYEY